MPDFLFILAKYELDMTQVKLISLYFNLWHVTIIVYSNKAKLFVKIGRKTTGLIVFSHEVNNLR